MARTSTFVLYSRIFEGLPELLRDLRTEGVSYGEIAHRLRDKDINVTDETVRRWCLDLEDAEGAA